MLQVDNLTSRNLAGAECCVDVAITHLFEETARRHVSGILYVR